MFPITYFIIVATILVSLKGFNDPSFFEKFKFNVSAVKYGQQYRLFSSGFLHADFFHLFFNMFSFWSFSPILLANFETRNILLIYFGSMMLGSLFMYYFHKNEPYYSAIGASGAVSGIIYSAVLLEPNIRLLVFFIPMPGYVFAVLYLAYSIFGMKGRFDNIGHTAHFGGALGGLVLTLLIKPELLYQNPLFIAVMSIPIIVLFVMIKLKKI